MIIKKQKTNTKFLSFIYTNRTMVKNILQGVTDEKSFSCIFTTFCFSFSSG